MADREPCARALIAVMRWSESDLLAHQTRGTRPKVPPKSLHPKRQHHAAPVASEWQECLRFIEWTRLVRYRDEPLFERLAHIPNERGKAGIAVARLVAIGLKPGFPDYLVLVPLGAYIGLFLEAKRKTGGDIDPAQVLWREKLLSWGYAAGIHAGADQMIAATRAYFAAAPAADWFDPVRP